LDADTQSVNHTNCHECVYYLNCFCQCRYCIYRDATTIPGNNLYTCKGSFSVSSEGPSRVTTVSGVGNSRRRVFAQNVEILLILMHLSILILGGGKGAGNGWGLGQMPAGGAF
jgi:hypothetical protein